MIKIDINKLDMKTIEMIGIDYGIFREYNEENE
jgi:hypothetical protein